MICRLLLLTCILLSSFCWSQKEADYWYFSLRAGINFTSGTAVVDTSGKVSTTEGSAAMCDAAGNLLFYTDGITVYTKNHQVMSNGTGLLGDISTTQSALIIQQPGSTNLCYIFTLPEEGSGNFHYSIVDMSLSGGSGSVTVKNTSVKGSVTEKLTAVKHCNGVDVWILIHELNSNAFYAYLLTSSGLSAPVVSNVGQPHFDVHGYMKFNHSGNKIACIRDTVTSPGPPYLGKSYVDILDFDRSSGAVSNPLSVHVNNYQKAYGLEFSQDDSKLYVGFYNLSGTFGDNSYLTQFDMSASNIASSAYMVANVNDNIVIIRSLQLGRDGKIYVCKSNSPFVSVVNSPNSAGAACSYSDNVHNVDPFSEGRGNLLGLPNFMQSYFHPQYPNLPVSTPSLNVTPFYTVNAGGTVTLNASGNAVSYSWTPSTALSSNSIAAPVANPSVTTVYTVVAVGTCTTSSAVVTVSVITPETPCGDLFVPTGFTPNGDGANDLECIMGNCIKELKFSIYDRWGEKVFETDDQSKCWTGEYKGKLMDTGVFVYYLKAVLKNGEEVIKKGNIHLIR